MTSETKPRAVYKLVRTDKPEDGTDAYVGSTSQPLKSRLWDHRASAKRVDSKLYTRMREVGVENWQILPLVICPCNKEEIFGYEKMWIDLLKPDLNAISPFKENNEKDRERVRRHYRDSLETKRYFCDVCNVAFGDSCNLKIHFNTKKHKNFEQLIKGVHKMIQNGTFSQALNNSKETSL